jgi:hypothetical protein
MQRHDRRPMQLVRALIACLALLCAWEAPVFAAWPERDTTCWVAAQGAQVRVATPAAAPRAAPALTRLVAPAAADHQDPPAAMRPSPDGRYLYLELQTLLC